MSQEAGNIKLRAEGKGKREKGKGKRAKGKGQRAKVWKLFSLCSKSIRKYMFRLNDPALDINL